MTTTRDTVHDADAFRRAHPDWPHVSPGEWPRTERPLRITAARCGIWPAPATVIGHATGEWAWAIAAMANEHVDLTGCQPARLPGYVPLAAGAAGYGKRTEEKKHDA